MKIVRRNVLVLAAFGVFISLIVVNSLSSAPWSLVFGPADLGAVDFPKVRASSKPNAYLVCPKDFCQASKPDQVPENFAVSAQELMQRAKALWLREPRVKLVHESSDTLTLRFVQRTALLKFPDTISVRFIPAGADQSTIALYSRSQIGYSDFGVNKARAKRWLKLL